MGWQQIGYEIDDPFSLIYFAKCFVLADQTEQNKAIKRFANLAARKLYLAFVNN